MEGKIQIKEQEQEAAELKLYYASDPTLRGLSLYEKKAVLVNRELDSHGMGRYQWGIWILCGFGYFLDLLWAMAFGLVLPAITPEFGLVGPKAAESGELATFFYAGLTVGALVWGFLVDIVGRWWAFNGTCLITALFGACLGLSNNYTTLLALSACCGFGVGGNIPIDTTICLEFLPQSRRFLLAALSLFQPLGAISACALAYALIPNRSCQVQTECGTQPAGQPCCDKSSNYGWRYYLFCLGAISVSIFLLRFVAFRFHESPKYLLSRGHDDKAAKVLEKIAVFNKRRPIITLVHFQALQNDLEAMTDHVSERSLLLLSQKKDF
eukprot:TRINITY_DN3505_c0_g1_i1.p1 TRINITY_DN3505_c0_g1~~TRINITY_DN3505_c0_g1_i1.p1  ORF type:complete len:325 (-),score=41.21 TRINITY_DN3505_c0_g1_i1:193-1167(-)